MKSLEEIEPGLTLGRYECLLPIARGGMAAVWAARVTGARGFEQTVAIKTMLPMLNDDPNFERMFLDEARIASRIRHPNVAAILDLGEQGNLLYLVMEWIDGAPLSLIMRESFRRGGMPIPIGVRIIQDVCAALHAAHELKGEDGRSLELVHRDVSPQNIMLTEGGIVKLVDFGVAKALGRSAGETDTGLIRGKLAYLAPEQVIDLPLDRRADLFAAGVILYQLTTGKHPFRADNAGATMNNILRRRVPTPSKIVGTAYPSALDSIVMRALDREPEFRFQTASEMLKALDRVFVGRDRATTEDVAGYIKPIIGPAGDDFRRALQKASGSPSNSRDQVASLLASGAHPVERTPASGNWLMGSASVRAIEGQHSAPPLTNTDVVQMPLEPSGSADSEDRPTSDRALTESTMSGAQRDTQPASRRRSKRRSIGLAVLCVVFGLAFFVAILARFVSPAAHDAERAQPSVSNVPAAMAVQSAPTAEPTAEATDAAPGCVGRCDAGPVDAGQIADAVSDAAGTVDVLQPSAMRTNRPSTPQSTNPKGNERWGNERWGSEKRGNEKRGSEKMGNEKMGNEKMGNEKKGNEKKGNAKKGNAKKWTPAVSDPGF